MKGFRNWFLFLPANPETIMRKPVIILTLAFLWFFQACSNENKQDTDQQETVQDAVADKNVKPESGTVKSDTIFLSGKFVLFYGPDSASFSSQKIPADSLKYFRQTSEILMDSLRQYTGISAWYSTVSFFKIFNDDGSDMVISRKSLKYETGVLVGDGLQTPTIKTGIKSPEENLGFIKKYFFLK